MVFVLITFVPVRAGGGPHNVTLLIDPQSSIAKQIGHHYQQARGIPDQNVIYMDPVPTSFLNFSEQHRQAFMGMLQHRGIADHIDYIVIPGADAYFVSAQNIVQDSCSSVRRFSLSTAYSLSFLADELLASAPNVQSSLQNQYFSDSGTAMAFSSEFRWQSGNPSSTVLGSKYFLCAVLGYAGERGNSASEIIDMIDRTIASDGMRPSGTFYFMETTDEDRSGPRDHGFPSVVADIEALGGQAQHLMGVLPDGRNDCLGIMTGWASPGIGEADLTLLPGSFGDHMTSFAATFNSASQEKVSAWIAKGASGSFGTVEEPCNYSGKFPTAQLHAYYFQGASMGEAAFRSLRYVPFQGLLYGDPLARPFAYLPSVQVSDFPVNEVKGTVEFHVEVATDSPNAAVSRVSVLVDGVLVTAQRPDAPITLDTYRWIDGAHDVRVVAADRSFVASQGCWEGTLVTRNHSRRATVLVTPPAGDLATSFVFNMDATGGAVTELRLMVNGRVIASAAGAPRSVSVLGKDFGPGVVQCYVEAEFAGGYLARSNKMAVSVEPEGTPPSTPNPPVAFGYRRSIRNNEPAVIELPATNPDGTELVYSIVDLPTHAVLWGEGATRFLHPALDASGVDFLTFFVGDVDADSESATITLDFGKVFGDLNYNGRTDLFDFYLQERCFGSDPSAGCIQLGADLNGDGSIDLDDISLLVMAMEGPA